jgi:hypothetical protein
VKKRKISLWWPLTELYWLCHIRLSGTNSLYVCRQQLSNELEMYHINALCLTATAKGWMPYIANARYLFIIIMCVWIEISKINIILATNIVAGSFLSAASQIPQCSLTLFTFLSVLEMKFLFALLQQTKMIEPHTLQYLLLLAFPIAVASTIVHNTFNSTVPSKPSMQFLLSKCSLVTLT